VVIASLIAATSLLGAVAAWRASVASSDSTSLDQKGFADSVADATQKARIRADLFSNVADYIRYRSFSLQADALEREARESSAEDAPRLRLHADVERGVAVLTLDKVSKDALRPDRTLDLARKFELDYREIRRTRDLDPRPEFAESDRLSTKSERLVGLTALLIAAAFFFTLAQVTKRRLYLLYLAAGIAVLLVAASLLAAVELSG
jgi:hypothetical protein